MSTFIDIIIRAQDKATSVLNKIENKAHGIGKNIKNGLDQADKANSNLQKSTEKVASSYDKVSKNVNKAVQSQLTYYQRVAQYQKNLTSTNNSLMNKIVNSGKSAARTVSNAFDRVTGGNFSVMASKAKSAMQTIIGGARSTGQTVSNAFKNMVQSNTFQSMVGKFKSAMTSMVGSAKSAAKSIASNFSNVEAGIGDILALAGGGLAFDQLFGGAQTRATMKQRLMNKYGSAWESQFKVYSDYAVKSSTPDEWLNRMFMRVSSTTGLPTSQTGRALSTLDVFASAALNDYERREAERNWGTYLQGGWESARGMMRDEPLTPEQKARLAAAKTPEERLAAMEAIAVELGYAPQPSVGGALQGMSTLTSGPLSPYTKALSLWDQFIVSATESFDGLLRAIEPFMDMLRGNEGAIDVLGKLAIGIGLLAGAGAAVRILVSALKGLSGPLKAVGKGANWLIEQLTGVNIKDKLSGLKQKITDAFSNMDLKGKLSSLKQKISDVFSNMDLKGKLSSLKQRIVDLFSSSGKTPTPTGGTGTPSTGTGTATGAGAGGVLSSIGTLAGGIVGGMAAKAALDYTKGTMSGYISSLFGGGQIGSAAGQYGTLPLRYLTTGTYGVSKGELGGGMFENIFGTGPQALPTTILKDIGKLYSGVKNITGKMNLSDIGKTTSNTAKKLLEKGIKGKTDFTKTGKTFAATGINLLKNKITGSINLAKHGSSIANAGINAIKNHIGGGTNLSNVSSKIANAGISEVRNGIYGRINLSAIHNAIKSSAIGRLAIGRGPAGPGNTTSLPRGPGKLLSGSISFARGKSEDAVSLLNSVFSGITYQDYPGLLKGGIGALLDRAGNCVDLTLAALGIMGNLGIPGRMVETTWNNGPHVVARFPGFDYDAARQSLQGIHIPPARGPSHGGHSKIDVNLNHIIDLKNVPTGNSDMKIADFVLEGLKDRKVMKELDKIFEIIKTNKKRSYGV